MASVTAFTADRMRQIEDTTVVGGLVDPQGNLLLQPRVGEPINAGYVRGPAGAILGATATSLPSTEQPTIDLSGTPTDRILEFGIPQGIQGPPGGSFTAAGTIALWASDTPPQQWLICDGSAISRTTYATLFDAIGTKYGTGDGATTFNVPNLKGRTPFGKDSTQAEFDNLGESGGTKSHSHSLSQAGQAQIYLASGSQPVVAMRRVGAETYTPTHGLTLSNLAGAFSTQQSVGAALGGSTDSAAELPPYQVVNFIIKATAGEVPADSQLEPRIGALESQLGASVIAIREKTARTQRGLTGGGIRKTGSAWFSWSGKFRALAAGRDDLTPAGYLNIEMPPDGTVIPAIGHNTVSSVTVASGRITVTSLSGYCALYYELPFGADYPSQPSRFRVVDYMTPIEIPPHWILVIARNVDGLNPEWTWGDGVRQDYWRTFALANGWVDFGGTFETHGWRFEHDGSIRLRGVVKNGTFSTTVAAASFPNWGPEGQKLFIQVSNTGHARVDVQPDGDLLIYAAYNTGSNLWVSFENVTWHPGD